jgi:hypothetical protein
MAVRRALIILVIATICALATPSRESEAHAACQYPFVLVKQHWWSNSCGPEGRPGDICNQVLTLVGEEGVDCDGNSVNWGYVTNYHVTYRKIWCDPICE